MKTDNNHQVVFHTNGIIDPLSWEIIGMSAKETDSAIGQFGSGLKFAIAVLLRTGHEIEVVTHDDDVVTNYTFNTITRFFRGKEFQIVTCNEKELGITTDMGKHWELWMAYRELVSNTMDEGGLHFSGDAVPNGTSILVRGEDFHSIMNMHNDYFVGDRECFYENHQLRIYQGNGLIFYRGVRVGKLDKTSHLNYEILDSLQLTEDRTIADMSRVKRIIALNLCCNCDDKEHIKKVICLTDKHWEHDMDFEWSWSDTFQECAREIWLTKPTVLNPSVAKLFKGKMADAEWETNDFTEDQEIMLNAVLDFMKKAEWEITCPILLVVNKDSRNFGFLHEGKIYLTSRAFDKGLFPLVVGLLCQWLSLNGMALGLFSDGPGTQYLLEELITTKRRALKIAF